MKLLHILITLSINYLLVFGYGESDSQNNPNHYERESFNLINLVRMFPTQYANTYMTGYTNLNLMFTTYKPTTPIYLNNTLNRMSKAHSYDMSTNNCFSHNDCVNGSSTSARFSRWTSCTGSGWGENIAAGSSTGIAANNLLICDATSGNACSADGSGYDGHRKNLMNANYKVAGVGYYYTSTSTYKHYWTQDLTGGTCNNPTGPIYSGYHTFFPSTNPQFIVNFYSKTLSTSTMSLVFVGGSTVSMTRAYGNDTFAVYTYTPTSFTVCAKYYFTTTTTSGATYRYPDTGSLQISKDTTCNSWTSSTTASSAINNLMAEENIVYNDIENQTNNSLSLIQQSTTLLFLLLSVFYLFL
ncbi:hypothetical protein DICPUDRAFT_95100 [Dictyostelium purpureum]|uniref:SCP domain-containing protein n=1 Tax=Dictyostelium purpureum TaxID=5786 RepID=F0ZS85_DICPU|nr:uncharacterized protein DICPUDRAFT_95100 [Dictyostelium purpureum]EGC33190.1 hypothetical protein DICPUDRAFT_95100 [Dictyostelium purpureum]|eukprot:XP_003290272.1 hypothetical protein DICPUDRAFT_95100 [Dictyostelium purpureum]